MNEYATDPVCGKQVDKENLAFDKKAGNYTQKSNEQLGFDKATGVELGESYYFCSEQCKAQFEKSPEQYTKIDKGKVVKGLM